MQVLHGHVVSAAETIPIIVTRRWIDVRMPVFFAAVHVWRAMMIEILAGAFDAVVKTLPLNVAKFGWRRVPASLILSGHHSLWSSRVGFRWR